jgi:hypothetical protein
MSGPLMSTLCGSLGNSGGINSVYFSISHNFFLLLRRVSKGVKRAVENSRGLLFDAYQERLGEICGEVPRGLLLGVHRQRFNFDGGFDGAENGHGYKCKNRVSIDQGMGTITSQV